MFQTRDKDVSKWKRTIVNEYSVDTTQFLGVMWTIISHVRSHFIKK